MKRHVLEKKTRAIFHKIHTAQGQDAKIYSRLHSLISTDYLRVKKDFFNSKVCLDAGCGSNANATYAMLQMGAKMVYSFDLDNTIFESVPRHLRKFSGRYDLRVGNVLNMDYFDDFFDFTHCAGVLHHTADAFLGLKELKRVTKIGGTLYIVIKGKSGLVGTITDILRDKYHKDETFKCLIDNLDKKYLIDLAKWIISCMKEQRDPMGNKITVNIMKKLFDDDLILTIKDRITAPLYNEYSEEDVRKWLSRNAFIKIKRLTRYPKYNNARAFLSPFYYKYDHRFSRTIYGDGVIQLSAVKSKKVETRR